MPLRKPRISFVIPSLPFPPLPPTHVDSPLVAPSVISIVAGVTKRRSNGFFGGVDAAASAAAFTPFVTSQGRPLALAHEGDVPPR